MDFDILAYIFAILAMFSFLNAMDYSQEYRRYYSDYTSQAQAKYAKTLRRNCTNCTFYGLLWTILAILFWFGPRLFG